MRSHARSDPKSSYYDYRHSCSPRLARLPATHLRLRVACPVFACDRLLRPATPADDLCRLLLRRLPATACCWLGGGRRKRGGLVDVVESKKKEGSNELIGQRQRPPAYAASAPKYRIPFPLKF